MRISAKCNYVCCAILELALHWPSKEPLPIQIISKNQSIPVRYLVQILIQLKQIGIVGSARGKQGGYNLIKSPEQLKLGKIIRSISGPLLPIARDASSAEKTDAFKTIWRDVENAMAAILDEITFADIVEKVRLTGRSTMYYI